METIILFIDRGDNHSSIDRGDNHSIIDRGDNHSIIDRGDNSSIIDHGDNHSIIDRGDNHSIIDRGDNTSIIDRENCENRNDPDLVQAFLKKWWVESDFKVSKFPAVIITVFITILEQNR